MREWKDEDEQEMYDLIESGAEFEEVKKFIFQFWNRESKYYMFYMLDKLVRKYGYLYSYEDMLETFKDLYVMDIYFKDVAKDLEYLVDTYRPLQNINSDKILTIYRGISRHSLSLDEAISWTTDKDIAYWFANRFHSKDKKIIEATVKESDVIYFWDRRKEKEVITLPRSVNVVSIEDVVYDEKEVIRIEDRVNK